MFGRRHLRFVMVSVIIVMGLNVCAHGNVEMTFTIDTVVVRQEEPTKTTEPQENLTVMLGPSYFSYDNGKAKVIFDFEHRRIYSLDSDAKTYTEDSLYAIIGFKSYEFQNRLELARIVEAAQLEDNPMAKTLSEHLFSLTAKPASNDVLTVQGESEIVHSWNDKELFAYSKASTELPPEYGKSFIRFIRYYLGGHPQILEALERTGGVPGQLRAVFYNSGIVTTQSLVLKAEAVTPDAPYSLDGYEKTQGEQEPLARLLSAVHTRKSDAFEASSASLVETGNAAFSEERYLETMLVYLEYTMQVGGGWPAQFESQKELLTQDEEVLRLRAAISPQSEEEAVKAVNTLVALRENAGRGTSVLMILQANTLTRLGKPDEAKALFLSALQQNPFIAGAWKDLGDLYYGGYDAHRAWRCWDSARDIAPEHKLLEPVGQFEKQLVSEYPAFF